MKASKILAKPFAAALGIAVLAAAPAYAADVVFQEPPAPQPAAPMDFGPIATWTGPYAGLQFGYGFGGRVNSPALGGPISNTDGWFGGAFLGYNLQNDMFVYGAEADLNYSRFSGSNATGDTSRSGLEGSLRARAGVAITDDILIYGMVVVTVFSLWLLYRTPVGLIVTATGENPAAVDAAGISVPLVRYICVIAGSALAGIGGCYLVLTQIFMFSENMSAGKGFIALAAVILGRWNPVGVICACMCFALFDAWQLQLQFNNPEVPHQFFTMLPFLISFMAMVGLMGRSAAPRSLGLMFVRGSR